MPGSACRQCGRAAAVQGGKAGGGGGAAAADGAAADVDTLLDLGFQVRRIRLPPPMHTHPVRNTHQGLPDPPACLPACRADSLSS